MKEATSELNMTVVIVLAVASLILLFTVVIAPSLKGSIYGSTQCKSAICTEPAEGETMAECTTKDGSSSFQCVWRG